jgi:hypothetical protein
VRDAECERPREAIASRGRSRIPQSAIRIPLLEQPRRHIRQIRRQFVHVCPPPLSLYTSLMPYRASIARVGAIERYRKSSFPTA